MILKYFTFSLSAAFISWIIGMIMSEILKKSGQYEKFANLNYITSRKANTYLGLGVFKWIVRNTFFKYFNPKLTIKTKVGAEELQLLRKEMTFSEISHLMAFAAVSIVAIIKIVKGEWLFALVITLVNVVMNLYPSLLQQENKRRIDAFLGKIAIKRAQTNMGCS